MWDNAPLLRNIADALIFFSVLALLYGALHYAVHRPELLPLASVRLETAPQRVDALALRQMLRAEMEGNFFTVDIAGLRERLERLSWVRSVSIRREFPDRLALGIEEHQPLARWNDAALVNTHGEVFQAESAMALPAFSGQEEADAAEIARRHAQFSQRLAALGLHIERIALTPRHAWHLELDNGMALELGQAQAEQRLARFVAGYPYIRAASAERMLAGSSPVGRVDLRYRNGFAIGS